MAVNNANLNNNNQYRSLQVYKPNAKNVSAQNGNQNAFKSQDSYGQFTPENSNITNLLAQNAVLRIDEPDAGVSIGLKLPYLDADLIDKTPNDPLNFQEIGSFDVNVHRGELSLSDIDLTTTVDNIIADETDLVKDFRLNFSPNNRADVSLKFDKFLKFNINVGGRITAQPNNNMVRFTPDQIKVGGIQVMKVLNFFGVELEDILGLHNKKGSVFTSGNSMYFSPTKLAKNPGIQGDITAINTNVGSISVLIGDKPKQTAPKLDGTTNYLRIRGGDLGFNGFNLQEADVILADKTPDDPFDIINDPSKTILNKGTVGIPEEFIDKALSKKAGGGSIKDMRFTMPSGKGRLDAKMWGFLPIKLGLQFGKSSDGQLKVTPNKGRVLGFIPLPNSLLRSTLIKETGGKVDGKGITIDLEVLADIKVAPLTNVYNKDGQLILEM